MQLLEHGADVHNHGAKTYQTPMRMAVTDLNMDTDMVDLLVSYGASPFLEAKDGKHGHAGRHCNYTPAAHNVQVTGGYTHSCVC